MNWERKENEIFIYLIILFNCASCIALNEIWKLGEMIRYRRCLLPFDVTVALFAWKNWSSSLQIKLSTILAVIWVFCFQHSSTEHYQITSKDAVIKLSFLVRWHVMLLMCCRLQELELFCCWNMTDRGLEGIGSLHELTSLVLYDGGDLTAQALSTFLHRPYMSSIISLNLSLLPNLYDAGLEGIAERCNKLTYLHI